MSFWRIGSSTLGIAIAPAGSLLAVTLPPLGGGAASYLSDTHTPTTGTSTVITRPAGAGSSHTLTAILYGEGADSGAAAPSGWTAVDSATADTAGARAFTAAGDVATLTFAHTASAMGIICFATTAPLRIVDFVGYYWADSPGDDAPTPSIVAIADDLVVSAYAQTGDGTGGAIAGPIQSGYTQRLLVNTAAPRASVISKAGAAAGATGTITHGGVANFATRFCLTAAFHA